MRFYARLKKPLLILASFGCLILRYHHLNAFVLDRRPTVGALGKRTPKHLTTLQFSKKTNIKWNGKKRQRKNNQHLRWLEQTTNAILRQPAGSLAKGKWHELVSMIKAWSKYSKSYSETPVIIEKLIKRIIDERQAGTSEVDVDIELYNILLDAWACKALFPPNRPKTESDHPAMASQRAREILVLLQENFEKTNSAKPNAESFGVVFHVVNKVEGPTIARRVLAWMEHLHFKDKNNHAQPLKKHYIMLLNSYANSRDGNAGLLAQGFIRHMKARNVQPDTLCYNIAIKAWMKARKGRESAEHAQTIFEEMDAPKDIVTYSSVIAAWAASGMRSHAVDRAEALLKEIYESPQVHPNTVVLNTVMSTWVKSRNPKAVQRTQELLQTMEACTHTNSRPLSSAPDLISYNTHLHALSMHAKKQGHDYAKQANDLLDTLERRYLNGDNDFGPNLFSYNLVIDAWSKSTDYDAAWNAVRVLRRLISATEDTPQPDAFSFNQVFSALSKSPRPGAAALAEKLLGYMEDAYNMKLSSARPDVVGYTSVITALARSGESNAGERAEMLFHKMRESSKVGKAYMKPNRATFNALIDCWAKSGRGTFAARKAEALLREMEERCENGDTTVSPNIVTYNTVLNCWAQSGTRCCGNQAEKYLDLMWKLYHEGDETIAPNELSFNTVSSIL